MRIPLQWQIVLITCAKYAKFVSSQARQELNPSQVTAYLRIKREPPEVEDTCISGDSSQDLQSR